MKNLKQEFSNILAIETGASAGSVSVLKNGILVALSFLDIKVTHSERLMPAIDNVLNNCNMKVTDLDAVCYANGPGSFTGIRIGLATAKGLCTGLNIPLIVANTITLLAMNAIGNERVIASVQDAKMGELYAGLFTENLDELIAPMNCFPQEFADLLKGRDVIFVGSAFELYESILTENTNSWKSLPNYLNFPMASGLFDLPLAHLKILETSELETLEPYYLRKSQAELVREKRLSEEISI